MELIVIPVAILIAVGLISYLNINSIAARKKSSEHKVTEPVNDTETVDPVEAAVAVEAPVQVVETAEPVAAVSTVVKNRSRKPRAPSATRAPKVGADQKPRKPNTTNPNKTRAPRKPRTPKV